MVHLFINRVHLFNIDPIGTSVRTALEGEKRKNRTQFNKRQRIPLCVPLYPPVWRFLSKVEEFPMKVENQRKNEFLNITKCDIFRAV